MINMDELISEIIKFRNERDWKKFHTPENLAKSISIESAELLEQFQWQNEYSIYMASAMNLDINEIILNKMAKNAIKYPIDKSKGNAKKYMEF